MEDSIRPATIESINNLIVNMKATMESVFREMYVDLILLTALKQGVLDTAFSENEKSDVDLILRIHSNVCYSVLCLCVHSRACFKSSLDVEKQYLIRRSAISAHETYKYLYGFTGKMTPWKRIEASLRTLHPNECDQIDTEANNYRETYANEDDETLRDVSKHFSDDPIEFFRNLERVNERNETDRQAVLLRFIQPIHMLLTNELMDRLGGYYLAAITLPLPEIKLGTIGIPTREKVDDLQVELEKYSDVVNSMMSQINSAEHLGKKLNLDIENDPRWIRLTENNIGLHILYLYLDLLSTLRAFLRSENHIESSQNFAYYILSSHEGLKKLYGFNEDERHQCFWYRSIKAVLTREADESSLMEVKRIEERLEDLSKNPLLRDEDMVVAFTHMGYNKRQKCEASFAVMDYFGKSVMEEDLDSLTSLLFVMNDIVLLYTKVLDLEKERINKENEAKRNGIQEMLIWMDKMMAERVKDSAALTKWNDVYEQLSGIIQRFADSSSNKKKLE